MDAASGRDKDIRDDLDRSIDAANGSVLRDRFEAVDVPVIKGTVKDTVNDTESLFDRACETADGTGRETETTSEPNTTEPFSEHTKDDDQADPETRSGPNDVDADQIGGDPRKGLFARLRRMFS